MSSLQSPAYAEHWNCFVQAEVNGNVFEPQFFGLLQK